MQPRGGLVKHEQGAAFGSGLAAGGRSLGGFGQKPGQLEALRLAARERGHRLTKLHVVQPHIQNGLQRPDDIAVTGKKESRLADGQVKDVGDVEGSCDRAAENGVRAQCRSR